MAKNIAILAHIDAGKTTLSERLLYVSREIKATGEVEDGLATMDYLAEEKQRGITIETGLKRYRWRNEHVYILDTPGHVDFSIEVDSSLEAADGAILIVSAKQSVQTQTLSAWRKLKDKNIPVIIYINALDDANHEWQELFLDVGVDLDENLVPLNIPLYEDGMLNGYVDLLGEKSICQETSDNFIQAEPQGDDYLEWRDLLLAKAAENNPDLQMRYLEGNSIAPPDIVNALAIGVQARKFFPVVFGAAKKNIGIRAILNAVSFYFDKVRSNDSRLLLIKSRMIGRNRICQIVKNVSEQSVKPFGLLGELDLDGYKDVKELKPGFVGAVEWDGEGYLPGQICNEAGSVIVESTYQAPNPIMTIVVELEDASLFDELKAYLERIQAEDPSVKINYNTENGCYEILANGELQIEIIQERVSRHLKGKVSFSSPQVITECRLVQDFTNLTGSYTTTMQTVSLSIDILPSQSTELVWGGFDKTEILENVIQSTWNELCLVPFPGYYNLKGTTLIVKNVEWTGDVLLPGLLKKALIDIFYQKLNEDAFQIFRPWVQVDLITPHDLCGKIMHQIEQKDFHVNSVDAMQTHTHIKCEGWLEHSFGWQTHLRDISKGQAEISLNLKGFK